MDVTEEYGRLQLSAIYEVANIGIGHAVTALSELTGRFFTMEIPRVDSVPLATVPDLIGGPEQLTVCTYMPFEGEIEGHTAFLFPWESAQELWVTLLGAAPASLEELNELHVSAMLEIGNIVNSSFLNAVSDMTGLTLHATPPVVSIEMAMAITETVVVEAEERDAFALAIETRIAERGDTGSRGCLLCIPTRAGLRTLFERLGISEAA